MSVPRFVGWGGSESEEIDERGWGGVVDEFERELSIALFSLTHLSEMVNVMGGTNVFKRVPVLRKGEIMVRLYGRCRGWIAPTWRGWRKLWKYPVSYCKPNWDSDTSLLWLAHCLLSTIRVLDVLEYVYTLVHCTVTVYIHLGSTSQQKIISKSQSLDKWKLGKMVLMIDFHRLTECQGESGAYRHQEI